MFPGGFICGFKHQTTCEYIALRTPREDNPNASRSIALDCLFALSLSWHWNGPLAIHSSHALAVWTMPRFAWNIDADSEAGLGRCRGLLTDCD